MSPGIYIIIILFVLFLPPFLYSDTIILKNGQKLEGKIIAQTKEKIRLQVAGGSTMIIEKKDITRILYDSQKKTEEAVPALPPEKKEKPIEVPAPVSLPPPVKPEPVTNVPALPARRSVPPYAMLKSVIFPGWGFHDIQQTSSAIFWHSLFLISAGGAVSGYRNALQKKDAYYRLSENLTSLVFLDLVEPFSLPYQLFTLQIQNRKKQYALAINQLYAANALLATVYFAQLLSLRIALENFSVSYLHDRKEPVTLISFQHNF